MATLKSRLTAFKDTIAVKLNQLYSLITGKADKTITISSGTGLTGGGSLAANRTIGLSTATQSNITKGVTAHGWGNHSQEGYATESWVNAQDFLTEETDPTVPSHVKSITTTQKSNWNTAYGWGNWSTGVDKTFVDNLNVDADTLDGQHGSYYLNYNNFTNKPDLSALQEIEYANDFAALPTTGNADKVYITKDNGYMYRWNGTGYSQLTDQTAIWGQVSGTLSNQTDLQAALNGKALKTINLTAGTGLTGGGNLSSNRTIGLSTATQSNIAKGVTAHGWGDHASAGYATEAWVNAQGFLTEQTDSQTLSWSGSTGALSISNGNSVDLDGRYSLTSHTHTTSDITNLSSYIGFDSRYYTETEVDDLLDDYSLTSHNHTLDSLSNVTITSNTSGEILKWNGSAWINNTLAQAGIASSSHTHSNLSTGTGLTGSTYNGGTARTFAFDTAWGDGRYLQSFTETDPIFQASPAAGISNTDITNWNEKGVQLTADQPNANIHLRDSAGNIISTLNVGFLNNEGTTISFNSTTDEIELRNDEGTLLSSFPASALMTGVGFGLNLTGSTLELTDSANNVIDSVTLTIANIQGLQTALDGKAPTTRTITAGTGLTGGGSLASNRTIGLSTTTQSDIAKGVTAHGWGNHASAGYIPYTGANQAVDLNTQDLTLNGNLIKQNSTLEQNIFGTGTSSTNNLRRYYNVASFLGVNSAPGVVVVTIPITTSTMWNAQISIQEYHASVGYTPIRRTTLIIGAYTTTNTARFVSVDNADRIAKVEFGKDSSNRTVVLIHMSSSNMAYPKIVIDWVQAAHNHSSELEDKTQYDISTIATADISTLGLTINGEITNANFQRDSYYLNYNNFTNTPTIPTVNNGQLTLSTGTGLSGSATFTANQSGSSTFSVAVASTHKLPTTAEWTAANTDTITRLRGTTSGTYTSGDLTLLAGANTTITQSGANITIASTNTNTTYSAGSGLSLTGTTFANTAPNATHTGDVTGATALTIANNAVTHDKYQNIPTQRILGRGATGTGNVQELTLGSNLTLSTGGVLSATNTNTTYSAGTLALLNTGTNTSNRVWSSKILNDWLVGKNYVTADIINGLATQTWVNDNFMNVTHAANAITVTNITDWNTAYGWGDHSQEGYLTPADITNKADKTTEITVGAGLTGGGDLSSDRTIGLSASTQTKLANGDTAFGWGDHSQEGYLTSADISNKADKTTTISAGSGMTGGGTLGGNRIITMGTPSDVTLSSTNSVTPNSHTHEFKPGGSSKQYIDGTGSLQTFPSYNMGVVRVGYLPAHNYLITNLTTTFTSIIQSPYMTFQLSEMQVGATYRGHTMGIITATERKHDFRLYIGTAQKTVSINVPSVGMSPVDFNFKLEYDIEFVSGGVVMGLQLTTYDNNGTVISSNAPHPNITHALALNVPRVLDVRALSAVGGSIITYKSELLRLDTAVISE